MPLGTQRDAQPHSGQQPHKWIAAPGGQAVKEVCERCGAKGIGDEFNKPCNDEAATSHLHVSMYEPLP